MLTRVLAMSLLMPVLPLHAQENGDASKGFTYAREVCAECHAIGRGEKSSPDPKAPSFEDIANSSGVTGISLAAMLHAVHENMPGFAMALDERDNIIAYILSLKREAH